MKILTIEQALNETEAPLEEYLLYVIGDGEVTFYVGQSLDPFQRLDEHLGKGVRMFASPMGKLVHDYFPASLAWTVQFFTLEDCVPAVQQHCPEYYPSYRDLKQEKLRVWKKQCMDVAEEALMYAYKPCLNILGSNEENSSPLPEKYCQPEVLNKGIVLRRERHTAQDEED